MVDGFGAIMDLQWYSAAADSASHAVATREVESLSVRANHHHNNGDNMLTSIKSSQWVQCVEWVAGAALSAGLCLPAHAADKMPLPPVAPAKAGFSAEGLKRIDQFFASEVAANRVPGAVIAIARDGKLVHYKAIGYLNKETGEPMPLDAIFNLASMTKIMASVGALKLNEEGRLPLQSRLDQYFPEFGNMKVGVPGEANGEMNYQDMARPITIHDLFRHTSGLTYGGRGGTPIHAMYPNGSAAALDLTGKEFIDKITKLPLVYQPGTVFEYGFSTDVLGLVVEKVANKRLGEHLKEVVWDKVGMPDTTFSVPPEKEKRLAQPLPNDPITGKPQRIALLEGKTKFDCGGACAFSTVADYVRFGQMLLNGGAIDGKRVLSPKTVSVMTSDHLNPSIKNRVGVVEPHREGYGFGLGVAVRLHDGMAAVPGTKGDYTWNGANGTAFWADPQERLVVVLATVAPGEIRKYYREQLGALVYGAMTELRKPRP
jgi:CubicO group peptidase (beta-lactamase class C family)